MSQPPRYDKTETFSYPADTALPGWLESLPAGWRPYAMLARLAALSDEHFDVHPDEVHWGHVGTLAHGHKV